MHGPASDDREDQGPELAIIRKFLFLSKPVKGNAVIIKPFYNI